MKLKEKLNSEWFDLTSYQVDLILDAVRKLVAEAKPKLEGQALDDKDEARKLILDKYEANLLNALENK